MEDLKSKRSQLRGAKMAFSFRLPERQLAERWVYPYIEETPRQYRVVLVLGLGMIVTEDQEPPGIMGEEVQAHLLDSRDLALELEQGPGRGPLPVAGGPSVSANAEFRFIKGDFPAETLRIKMAGADASFSLSRERLSLKKGQGPR